MSEIGNNHAIVALKSLASSPVSKEQFLLRCVQHSVKDKSGKILEARESKATLIPASLLQLTDEQFLALKNETLESVVIPAMKATVLKLANEGKNFVASEQLSFDALLPTIREKKLTSDDVAAWFTSEVAPIFTVMICAKLNWTESSLSPEQEKKVSQTVTVYKDKIASLVSAKNPLDEMQEGKIRAILADADDSPVKDFVLGKLNKLQAIEEESLF